MLEILTIIFLIIAILGVSATLYFQYRYDKAYREIMNAHETRIDNHSNRIMNLENNSK